MSQPRIYLDHAATTPMLPEAKAAVMESMERWANPSSPHREGRAAKAELEQARARIKAALGWEHHLIFTSGASEAIALALKGRGQGAAVSAVEHDAVLRLDPGRVRVPVGADGLVDLGHVDGDFLAIQSVNSETGVIQPLGEIRARSPILFSDCAQSAGKFPLPDADLISLSAHKLGGPPGIGALLVRDLALLDPVGGQEEGYRPGTENLPAILGFAAALEQGADWFGRMARLRAMLEAGIEATGGITVARDTPRIPTIGSYRLPGLSAQAQLIQLDLAGIAVSAGSACSSGTMKPSHVLQAMGWSDGQTQEVIRVSFGWTTTEADIARFLDAWTAMATRARAA